MIGGILECVLHRLQKAGVIENRVVISDVTKFDHVANKHFREQTVRLIVSAIDLDELLLELTRSDQSNSIGASVIPQIDQLTHHAPAPARQYSMDSRIGARQIRLCLLR